MARPRQANKARTIDEWRNGTESGLTVQGVQVCTIKVPMAAEMNPNLFTQRHVDVRFSRPEALAVRRLREGLQLNGATLENGKSIYSNADVLRWILQQVPAVAP